MQALAHIHGARVHQAPIPVHGHLSHISHSNHPLFADIPSGEPQSLNFGCPQDFIRSKNLLLG